VASSGGLRRELTIGAAIVLPVAFAIWILVPHDHTNEIAVEEIVDRFRASTVPNTSPPPSPSPSTSGRVVPVSVAPVTSSVPTTTQPAATAGVVEEVSLVEPGVYVYRTSGSESVDAFSGVTHEYPAETTITVTAEGCGVLLRWDALEERHEEWRLCTTEAGIELQPRSLQYHEFFDQETPEHVVCDRPTLVVPVTDESTGPNALTCTIEDRPWLPRWEVLESDVREIDGVTVDVRHVRMTIDDDDEHFEHYVADWLLAPNGLPVELSVSKQSKSPTVVGDVTYHETVQLALVSTEPLR